MTLTYARKLAREARRWGYYETGPTTAAVKCPRCSGLVETVRPINESIEKALDRSMVEHLLHDCDAA